MARSRSRSARRGFLSANPPFNRSVASSLRSDLRSLEGLRRSVFGEKLLLEHDPVRDVFDTLRQQLYDSTVRIDRPKAPWARGRDLVRSHLMSAANVKAVVTRGPLYKTIIVRPAGSKRTTPALGKSYNEVIYQNIGYDPLGPLDDVIECVERGRRREVLFAMRKTGKGGARNQAPRYTDKSQVDC